VSEFLPFIVVGIATGAVYSLMAAGLLLTFKTSGIFNFGHGAIATAAAYLFYFLHYVRGYNWEVSFILAALVAGLIIGLLMERVARLLANQRTDLQVVGTVGIYLLVEGIATVTYGTGTIRVEQFLPYGNDVFSIGGVDILYSQATITAIGFLLVGALYVLFRWTRTGIAVRAVVDNPDLLSMSGTSAARTRRISWIIGSVFATASGVLLLPFLGLNATVLTLLVVQAFGAAAIGSFSSLPWTFVGGIGIGIVSTLSEKYVVSITWLAGLPEGLPVIILFVVLLVIPRRKLVKRGVAEKMARVEWRARGPFRAGMGACIAVVLLLVPVLVGSNMIGFYTAGIAQAIIILSLGLLVRMSGQVSLCHATFAAIGAVVFSQLVLQQGIPWFAALFIAALVVAPVGALVALPAIRLSGVFLALATFGFGIAVQQLLYPQGFMFGALTIGRSVPRPSFATSNSSFYYVVMGFLVVTAGCIFALQRSRLGRLLRGLGEAPAAVETMGLGSNVTRVIVFSISAFIAAIAGILYSASVHFAVSTDPFFSPFQSLTLLAVLALAPFGAPWYAVFGGVAAVIPGYFPGVNSAYWLDSFFGVSAIFIAVTGGQPAMPEFFRKRLSRLSEVEQLPSSDPPAASHASSRGGHPVGRGLELHGVSVKFGGLTAVDNLTLRAPVGVVTGLIGPNGAGKTSTFDACSGLNTQISGEVKLHAEDITKYGPPARARRGLGRTFQRMHLADSLTVWENVALGREAGLAGSRVGSQLLARRSETHEIHNATSGALELCGISGLASFQAGGLSTGQRRLVELARCLAGDFNVLLLDEPSSGLDEQETRRFLVVLRRILAERGCGILLVEHDMAMVMEICSYIYVLDFGRLIFEGDPNSVIQSSIVQDAYLGTAAIQSTDKGGIIA
jgi:ABC-type branched-subunit amino acid transport system ATPase component/branched-subunit amino acid ABC-type transport system permease component